MLRGTNNILQNIIHIQIQCGEYSKLNQFI